MIPTAGISVPGAGKNGATRQYVNFMSVRSWDSAGPVDDELLGHRIFRR